MSDQKLPVYPVLLAGGTGSRLWPVSRELYPKQLVKFIGEDSLVQTTVKRLSPVLDPERVRIVCGLEHFHEIARHMEEIGVQPQGKIICEPCGRNTAPAILLAVLNVLKKETDAVLTVFPADHVIKDVERFHAVLGSAIRLAAKGYIVTFGIKPGYPETGYGYIEGGEKSVDGARVVKRFVEKPDRDTAEKYVAAGNFFWNSGMFAFRASVIAEEFKLHVPELFNKMEAMLMRDEAVAKEDYEELPSISIDYAIMERTARGVVLPSDFGWSDIGSWKSLYDFLPKDANQNVIDGDVIANDTVNCFIMGRQRLIATNHLNNMVVVETPDSVFVSDLENSRDVKSIVTQLKLKGRKEYHEHRTVHYGWGSRTLLEQKNDFCVTRLVLYPDAVLQVDTSAAKHMVVAGGRVRISSGGVTRLLARGESFEIIESEDVKLENAGKESVCLIQLELN